MAKGKRLSAFLAGVLLMGALAGNDRRSWRQFRLPEFIERRYGGSAGL